MGGLQRTFQSPRPPTDRQPPAADHKAAAGSRRSVGASAASPGADQRYRRAVKAYEQGAWDEVIDLLVPITSPNNEMRTLLAAARWQIALARQQARRPAASAPAANAPAHSGRSRWALNGLIAANLVIYVAIIFIVYFIWQRGSFLIPGLAAQAAHEDPLLGQAQAAITAEDWDTAVTVLRAYLDLHPGQVEPQTKLAYANEQRRRAALFTQATGYFDRKRYDQALETLRRLQATAPDFKPKEVASYVCKSIAQQTHAQVAAAQAAADKLLPLRTALAQSASECPGDPAMSQARRLLDLFIAGLEASQLKHWEDARGFFREIYAADPDYAAGIVAQRLYQAHAALGLAYVNQSQWPAALEEFNQALALGIPDTLGVTQLRAQALAGAIATATPTATSSPTPTPLPTATPTPAPTRTPRPRAVYARTPTPVPASPAEIPAPEPSLTPSPVPPREEARSAGGSSQKQPSATAPPTQPAPTSTQPPPTAPPPPPTAAPTPEPPDRPPTPKPR